MEESQGHEGKCVGKGEVTEFFKKKKEQRKTICENRFKSSAVQIGLPTRVMCGL